MLKNKRNVLFVLLILLLMVVVVGCGNKDNSVIGNDKNNTEKNTENSTENNTDNNMQNNTDGNMGNNTETDAEDTTQEKKYTFSDFYKDMYTTANINVRDLPTTDGNKIGGFMRGTKVLVTGQCKETGWYRVEYDDGIGYVSDEYLSIKLPSGWVAELEISSQVTQMIVVTAENSTTTDATVSMHTKNAQGIWEEIYSTKGKIGRNGLGKEREGDGKSPVGVFSFTSAFGILPNPGITVMPYLQVDETHHWVDDPESKYYNQCVSTKDVIPDWKSTEHLYKYVGDYNYSLSTSYNEACTPYVGCAIFLHCTNAEWKPTSGCIAIEEEYMIKTMVNLQSDCVIIIDTVSNIKAY